MLHIYLMLDLCRLSSAWKTKTCEATQYILVLVSSHSTIVVATITIVRDFTYTRAPEWITLQQGPALPSARGEPSSMPFQPCVWLAAHSWPAVQQCVAAHARS